MATIHQMNRGPGDGTGSLLTIGATGDAVKTLQQQLNKLRVTFIAILEDGTYSNDTANAVKAFQGKSGLNVTGSVDNATRDALVAATGAATVAGTTSLAVAGPPPAAKPKFALWQLGLMVAGGLALVGGALWVVTKKDDEGEDDDEKDDDGEDEGTPSLAGSRTVDGEVVSRSHVKALTKPTKVKTATALAKCNRTPDETQLAAGEVLLPP